MFKKKWFRIILALSGLCLIFNQCMQDQDKYGDIRGAGYIGSVTCIKCHEVISKNYATTAHARSSCPADRKNIKGSFHEDSNQYQYTPHVKVSMQERKGRFFQVAYLDEIEKAAYPFDIVIGSGRKAQTYLYWLGSNAYQLPVTYSVNANSWVNSPNYPSNKVRFDRMIPVGCFECHSSFIERTGIHEQNAYRVDDLNPNKIIYGIDCERCHGPAAEHVNYQTNHPSEKMAKYITAYKNLSNFQRLENCAACHSGIHEPNKSPFFFKPGEILSDYFKPEKVTQVASEMDVHGNQYQLLQASKCFKGSIQQMSCSSCHNPHLQERNNLEILSAKCMSCHAINTSKFCSFAKTVGSGITSNCIDCHMPASASKTITLQSEGQKRPTANIVRSHLIAIYPDISKKQLIHFILNK